MKKYRNIICRLFPVIVAFIIAVSLPVAGAEGPDPFMTEGPVLRITGQYKNLFTRNSTDNYYGDSVFTTEKKVLVTDLNRLRLSPEFRYGELIVVHVDYDNEIFASSFNRSYEFDSYWRPSEYNQFLDLTWEPVYNRDVLYRTKIHRAYAKLSMSRFTLTAGRQLVRFGSGRLWNPLDILNPISPTFVEGAEEQKGTDAMRVDYYIGESTELSLVFAPNRYNDEFREFSVKNGNSVARLKTASGKTDIALLGGWIARRAAAGLDIAATVLDGTLRGGVLLCDPENGQSYMQGSAGYEYTFSSGLYFLVEYFYNENALNRNTELKLAYEASFITGISQDNFFLLANQFITLNSHYTGLALGYDFFPLVRGELFSIYDFEGRGVFTSGLLKYNMLENLDVTAGVFLGHVFRGSHPRSDFREFRGHPLWYASITLYF